jgi:hypothetical protein
MSLDRDALYSKEGPSHGYGSTCLAPLDYNIPSLQQEIVVVTEIFEEKSFSKPSIGFYA